MRGLLFLGRVTFICNLFFIICLLLRHTHFIIPVAFREFVIITGWILSVLLNFIFVLATIIFLFQKKKFILQRWLLIVNSFFFLIQISYFLHFK